ncbi:MAG: hypothetical protein LBF81_01290 [Prevotellaceae bacterium]|nr:hypothetical protein [Prevotellaceae bacterium]
MKKIFFLFAMLASVAASAQVTNIEPVNANYATKTVSFRVWWNAGSRDATHLSKVWVWVDYIKVNTNNTASGNTWTRAAVSAASPTASVSYDGSNRQGFWLQGSSGSYSATVTVQLNITELKFNWCAYVSDYPPNVTLDKGTYTFKGTTDFIVSNPSQTLTTKTIAKSSLSVNSSSTFTDATGCPGIGSLYCPYTGSDLYMDASHLCQQRTSGAKNWEAWIKDTRDNELYRIVFMPDDKWWLAQNIKLASYGGSAVGSEISGCTKDECGRTYSWAQVYASYAGGSSGDVGNVQGICPPGWLLPVKETYATLVNSFGDASTACASLRAYDSPCPPVNDHYGWAGTIGVVNGVIAPSCAFWYTNDYGREDGFGCDRIGTGGCGTQCDYPGLDNIGEKSEQAVVRCFRQL